MKRLLIILCCLIGIQTTYGVNVDEPLNMKKYGWKMDGKFWTKTVFPNYAENNRGRAIKKNPLGQYIVRMAFCPEKGVAILYSENTVGLRCARSQTLSVRSGVYFKVRRGCADNIKYDNLGRIIECHVDGNELDDTYKADGVLYRYTYYGNTDVVKRRHECGWRNYPKDKELREKKFPETIGCVPYEYIDEYVFDTVNHTCRSYCIKTTAYSSPRPYNEIKSPGEYNIGNFDRNNTLEYDCNGNPFKVKFSDGTVYYLYYSYE